jgi:DNA mismatch endonuclease (patch repair protein)
MIHGCFWHGHGCKEGLREPKSNRGYWLPKIERNRQRDAQHLAELALLGWSVLTVWECEMREPGALAARLAAFLAA